MLLKEEIRKNEMGLIHLLLDSEWRPCRLAKLSRTPMAASRASRRDCILGPNDSKSNEFISKPWIFSFAGEIFLELLRKYLNDVISL